MHLGLDQEQVKDLKRSKRIVGEIDPVILDQRGRAISGRHRKAAGWKTRRVVKVKDELDYLVKRLHMTVQRHSSQQEQAELFRGICKQIENQGRIDKEKIGKFVLDNISPFEKSYTTELLPDEYKRRYHSIVRGADNSTASNALELTIRGVHFRRLSVEQTGGAVASLKETAPERERSCPYCERALLITDDYLVFKKT